MKKEITIQRTINAPIERVWKAWTDEKEVAKWWGPNGVTIPQSTLDPKPNGELYIVMLAGEELGPMKGQEWPMKGTFKEVVENELLTFSSNALDSNGNSLLEGFTKVTFETMDDSKTKLTIVTSAEGTGPAVQGMLSGMEQGWNEQIDKLVQLAESNK